MHIQLQRFQTSYFLKKPIRDFILQFTRYANKIVPTNTQMGFFVRTSLAARYIHRREMWVVSLKNSSSVEFGTNFCLNFVFFEEISRIDFLCEQGIFVMNLFSFSVIFHQIKIIFIKISIQNYISRHKMHQFWVPNRRKAMKRLVLVSWGSLL